jgi:hypothetical protein
MYFKSVTLILQGIYAKQRIEHMNLHRWPGVMCVQFEYLGETVKFVEKRLHFEKNTYK